MQQGSGATSRRRAGVAAVGLAVAGLSLALGPAGLATAEQSAPHSAPATGAVYVVQALPGTDVSVSVDGDKPRDGIATGTVLGPWHLPAGEHRISVMGTHPAWKMQAAVDVTAGRSTDVVVHLPAAKSGTPMATAVHDPLGNVAAGLGRVLVAHVATAPPADVEVDGKAAFTDVANGQFATADVPAGVHSVLVLPASGSGAAFLGPLDLDAKAGMLTSVYAVGNPDDDSMDVVVHQLPLRADGAVAPDDVQTGSAGLVTATPQVTGPATTAADSDGQEQLSLVSAGLALVLLLGVAATVRSARRPGGSYHDA